VHTVYVFKMYFARERTSLKYSFILNLLHSLEQDLFDAVFSVTRHVNTNRSKCDVLSAVRDLQHDINLFWNNINTSMYMI